MPVWQELIRQKRRLKLRAALPGFKISRFWKVNYTGWPKIGAVLLFVLISVPCWATLTVLPTSHLDRVSGFSCTKLISPPPPALSSFAAPTDDFTSEISSCSFRTLSSSMTFFPWVCFSCSQNFRSRGESPITSAAVSSVRNKYVRT